ncbi:hypothetical protein YWIDRAFT_05284 [Streptomyces sp. SceaMP-e96]|uniref:hypothetical protein n=1 Tax=unclassified Streptomyces TaxID=2593676 RepID=UPI000823B511|nr:MULTISPECIES: hypothetical protein [unclassified Streptomyces]SCK24694.1 hypothetical protein YWIDRAFT_05284 [Streptomyces sp. SceaMP-e96]
MAVLVLCGVLVLAVGGGVCVVWAARGGPRWVRVVSAVTLVVCELVSHVGSRRRSPTLRPSNSDD